MPPLDGTPTIEERNARGPVADEDRDRMESLARMGNALSGEMVPLLTVLNNILQLARVGLEKGDPARKVALNSMATADRAMDTATALLRRLEQFGSSASGRPERIDLASFVRSRFRCMSGVLGSGIELTIDGTDEPAVVRIDSRRLDQLIGELLRNASESMRGSGEVVIRIERHDDGVDQPPLIRMTFEDDGPGMNAESMRRAFEPFFTTRHHEIGIGLGLSMGHTTVNAAGGRMSLSSGDAGGLRVHVDLPPAPEREVDDIGFDEIPALNSGGVGE